MINRLFCLLALGMLSVAPARAQFDSGSDGSDGALDCAALFAINPDCSSDCSTNCSVEIDLGLAATASWDTPSPVAGQGVYDPDQWAVVFKYTTIDIPAGVTLTFSKHPSWGPVVWLALGDVTIAGAVDLRGNAGDRYDANPSFAEPGPGGFEGAQWGRQFDNMNAGTGLGPGGGTSSDFGHWGAGGSYGTVGGPAHSGAPAEPVYGTESIIPLIGGSGGGASITPTAAGGGAGGGAILVASSGQILLPGSVLADGGWAGYANGAGGSGGGIRLIANTVSGSGQLRAPGGGVPWGGVPGGAGRIRIEAHTISLGDGGIPNWTSSIPGAVFPPANAPTLKATFVDSVAVPADPLGGILTADVSIDNLDPAEILIEATNIPVGTTVDVRIVPDRGDVITVTSTPLVGAFEASTATAQVTFPPRHSEMQLRANWTP